MNILIVEDDQVLSLMLKRMIEEIGHQIAGVAVSGQEAIRKALSEECDLILMDIMLLGQLDGIDAYRKICEQKHIPIIYTTGNSDQRNRERARKIGYHDFLTKPISFKELKTSIEQLNS
ncbi:MAG: response regulator [Balneolaceae bacterium]